MRRLNLVSPAHKDSIRTSPVAEPMSEEIVTSKRRNGQRNWVAMSDPQLITFALEFMMEKGITTRSRLAKADSGLYAILRIRNLLAQIEFEDIQQARRNWKVMDDLDLIKFAQEFLKKSGIKTRRGLREADSGLHMVLRKRNLLKLSIPESKHEGYRESRDWTAMKDEEIVGFAKKITEEKRITTRTGLMNADPGLYGVLKKRNLLAQIEFEEVLRDWATMTDEAVIEFAHKFMGKNGITTRTNLQKADTGLYRVLMDRKLLDLVEFAKLRREGRDWEAMEDLELVSFVQGLIREKGITKRKALKRIDQGIYQILRKRNLLDHAFAEVDETKRAEGLDAVCEALEDFGEEG